MGSILPQTASVSAKGFTAVWKSGAFTKNYPSIWIDSPPPVAGGKDVVGSVVSSSAFGVAMFQPVTTYTQTMRSVKYAALCIILTFAAFFIIELVSRRSINAFQYVLIGLALLLFYTLLLSISEYIGFSYAYLIAALATVALITWFSSGVLYSTKYSLVLCLVLALTYTYIFTTLQVQDYALLLGSIGLFVALAVIMHFSKRISSPVAAPQL
jgi:inner membrane protein